MPSSIQRSVESLAENWQPLPYGKEVSWHYRAESRLYKGTIVCFVKSRQSAREVFRDAVMGKEGWLVEDLDSKVGTCLRGIADTVMFDRYIVQMHSSTRHLLTGVEYGYVFRSVSATTVELQNAHFREKEA